MINSLLAAAILPVFVLCYFIYKRDINKEPKELLMKLFILGCLVVVPVVIFELLLGYIFPTDKVYDFFILFINVFISVGLVEEGFKWISVNLIGYNSEEFDEVYDIIVYAVFASLGFACIENIIYVYQSGFGTAVMRALTAIPGHTSFAVIMGYYLSKAKVNEINGNNNLRVKNLLLSIIMPALVHSFYDAILLYSVVVDSLVYVGIFYLFIIVTYIVCFIIVDRISKVQSSITQNVKSGNIIYKQGNVSMNTAKINLNATQNIPVVNEQKTVVPNYCPICGKPVKGANYCGFCGYKLKE